MFRAHCGVTLICSCICSGRDRRLPCEAAACIGHPGPICSRARVYSLSFSWEGARRSPSAWFKCVKACAGLLGVLLSRGFPPGLWLFGQDAQALGPHGGGPWRKLGGPLPAHIPGAQGLCPVGCFCPTGVSQSLKTGATQAECLKFLKCGLGHTHIRTPKGLRSRREADSMLGRCHICHDDIGLLCGHTPSQIHFGSQPSYTMERFISRNQTDFFFFARVTG